MNEDITTFYEACIMKDIGAVQPMTQVPPMTLLDLLRHFKAHGVTVTVTTDGRPLCRAPEGAIGVLTGLVKAAITAHWKSLVQYYTHYPQEQWPACFFSEQGKLLTCIRGHPYDLCKGEDGRSFCKCYYDFSYQEQRRI